MAKVTKIKRRRTFVDWEVQGALVLRAFLQWSLYLVASFTLVVLWCAFSTGLDGGFAECLAAVQTRYAPMFCALVLLLPFAVWDAVKTSHRFVGPIHRLRKTLNQLARGEEIAELKFRSEDYWGKLAEDFNAALAREGRNSTPPAPRDDASSHAEELTAARV